VFCLETLAAYEQIDPLAVKTASPEATNEELLEAASGLPMLVSTGALNWGGTDRVNVVLRALGADYALLHCVSAYPAEPEHLNLAVIPRMMDRYRVPIGLSDHSDGDEPDLAPVLAIGAGASVIEKHITLSRAGDGPDHSFALESWEFKLMVDEIRLSEYFMGDGVKRVQPSEDATDRRAA
jgi:sialic acid synthase SpsE